MAASAPTLTPPSVVRSFTRPEPVAREETGFQPQEGWLAVILLLTMVLSTVWSIDQAKWVEGTGVLFPLALAGMVVGFLLARSSLAGWVAVLLGVVGGTALCFVVAGQLVPAPAEMLANLGQTLGGTLTWFAKPAGVPPLIGAFQHFFAGATEFGGRVGIWTAVGANGQVSNDNAMFLLFIAFVAWL